MDTLSINNTVRLKVGTLGIGDIAQLAAVVADLLLLVLIKDIKARAESAVEVLNVTLRVKSLPRLDAGATLASLEDEEQRIETGDDLLEGDAQKVGGRAGVLVEEVVDLVRVGLRCVSD